MAGSLTDNSWLMKVAGRCGTLLRANCVAVKRLASPFALPVLDGSSSGVANASSALTQRTSSRTRHSRASSALWVSRHAHIKSRRMRDSIPGNLPAPQSQGAQHQHPLPGSPPQRHLCLRLTTFFRTGVDPTKPCPHLSATCS